MKNYNTERAYKRLMFALDESFESGKYFLDVNNVYNLTVDNIYFSEIVDILNSFKSSSSNYNTINNEKSTTLFSGEDIVAIVENYGPCVDFLADYDFLKNVQIMTVQRQSDILTKMIQDNKEEADKVEERKKVLRRL